MRGQTTVLDSSNTAAVLADALGEAPVIEAPKEADKPTNGAETKPATEIEAKPAKADEAEDDNGLTETQKKELTAKMQSAIGKKHRALKEAEEFATGQYNERRLAEERAARLEREIERYKAQLGPGDGKTAAVPVDAKPERANYANDEEFANALVDWRVDQKLKAKEADDAKKAQERAQQEIIAQAAARVAKAQELIPDWAETMEGADIEVPPHIGVYMQESELLAELSYHFAKNPDVLRGLSKLTPHKALVEIGKIESTLKPFGPKTETNKDDKSAAVETAPAPSPKPRAAAPITPLNGGSGSQVEKPEREMTYSEVRAAVEREKGIKLSRRQRH